MKLQKAKLVTLSPNNEISVDGIEQDIIKIVEQTHTLGQLRYETHAEYTKRIVENGVNLDANSSDVRLIGEVDVPCPFTQYRGKSGAEHSEPVLLGYDKFSNTLLLFPCTDCYQYMRTPIEGVMFFMPTCILVDTLRDGDEGLPFLELTEPSSSELVNEKYLRSAINTDDTVNINYEELLSSGVTVWTVDADVLIIQPTDKLDDNSVLVIQLGYSQGTVLNTEDAIETLKDMRAVHQEDIVLTKGGNH